VQEKLVAGEAEQAFDRRTLGQPTVALGGAGMYRSAAGIAASQPIVKMQPVVVLMAAWSLEQSLYRELTVNVTFCPGPATRGETPSDELVARGCPATNTSSCSRQFPQTMLADVVVPGQYLG